MSEEDFISIFIFLFGTIVGSFLNVCIVRMPEEKSVLNPPSHCPQCRKPIAWYDNIPIISYLVLLGRCRDCSEPFSMRYFWVELLTGCVFLAFYHFFGFDLILIPYLFMVSCFIVTVFVDFAHRIIPDEISVGGMFFGLLFSLLIPALHNVYLTEDAWWLAHLYSLGWSVVGVLVGGGAIYAMGILGDLLFKKESMGGGDIKLMAMIGAFLGWKYALLTFFLAPFFGAVFGIIEKLRTGDTTIAYGPFIVAGALLSLFLGDQIIAWILSGYGLY